MAENKIPTEKDAKVPAKKAESFVIVPGTSNVDATQVYQPRELRDELRAYMRTSIRAGVTSSETLKTDAKNFLKQRVNETILSKVLPPQKSFGGFVRNAREDVVEVVDGIGALLGLGYKAALNPIDSIKSIGGATAKLITSPGYRSQVYNTFVRPIISEYKEYRDPLTKAYEDPLQVFLDVTAIGSLAGKSLKVAGDAAKIQGLVSAGEKLEKISTPLRFENLSNATKAVIRALPEGEKLVKNIELGADTRKMLTKTQVAFLNIRNSVLNEADKNISKLSDNEAKLLPLVVEGFEPISDNATPAFRAALGMVKSLADDQARFGLSVGALTPEIIERRKFQPMAKFLEAEGELDAGPTPYENLTGAELNAYIRNIKKFFPDADPIYMRHFFEDNPKRFSNFFVNTQPVRSFKPGFLKKSTGKEGYIGEGGKITKDQLKDVLSRQATENLKWQANMALIERLKKHPEVKPLAPGDKPLPGYKIFAPDGYLRFYKGTIDLAKELQKNLAAVGRDDDIWEMFGDSVNNIFSKKDYIGVTKAKLYQAPEAMVNELIKSVTPTPGWVKLFYDKPVDVFKASALALTIRWWVNNVIGNVAFSIVNGDIFNPKAFYIQHQARKAGALPDDLFGGVHATERTTSGQLGAAAEMPWVRSTVAMHDALLNRGVVGKVISNIEKGVKKGVYDPLVKLVDTSFKINQYVDDTFKGAAFINKTLKEERKNFLTRMVAHTEDSIKFIEDLRDANPAQVERLVDDIHKKYYYGLNLTNFERRIIRRVMPFYSWIRWSSLYAYHVSSEMPVRANIIANMAKEFHALTGQDELPEHMRGAIPVGTDADGTVYYLMTRGVNPLGTIGDLMSGDGIWAGLTGTAAKAFSPLIKTFKEQASGEDAFLDRPFTRKDVAELFGGKLYKVDPETKKVEELGPNDGPRPRLIENLLRNFIPQYLLLETVLTGGNKRYTAEGLGMILLDIIPIEEERRKVVKDILGWQGRESVVKEKVGGEPLTHKRVGFELMKSLGVNIKDVMASDTKARQEALERATTMLKNRYIPILGEDYSENLKKQMMEEIMKGTSKEEIRAKVKKWILRDVTDLKNFSAAMREPKTVNDK